MIKNNRGAASTATLTLIAMISGNLALREIHWTIDGKELPSLHTQRITTEAGKHDVCAALPDHQPKCKSMQIMSGTDNKLVIDL